MNMTESPPPVTLDDQISCVMREITLRHRLYPRWVGDRKMSQHKADTELATMEAVLVTLTELHATPERAALVRRALDEE